MCLHSVTPNTAHASSDLYDFHRPWQWVVEMAPVAKHFFITEQALVQLVFNALTLHFNPDHDKLRLTISPLGIPFLQNIRLVT